MKKVTLSLISIFLVLLVPLLTLSATSAWAATYYVDATNGNDSTGVSDDINYPYKTIYKINSLSLSPGDSVLFKRGGCWRETLYCSWSGLPGLPITFGAYGTGDMPVIHGGTIVTSWTGPDGNGVYTFNYSGVINWLLEDNLALNKASDGTCINGNWYYDNVTLYYKPTSGTPANHTVDRLTRGSGFCFSTANNIYITIDSLKFIGLGIYGTAANSALNNIIIQKCNFDNVMGGVALAGRNGHNNGLITIQDCTFNRCGQNIYLYACSGTESTTAIIQRNTITNSNLLPSGVSWPMGDRDGISLQNLINSTIQHNDISGLCDSSAGICHWIGNGVIATGNVFMYNYIHDVAGAGIIHGGEDDGTASCLIAYNIIKNFGTGIKSPGWVWGGLRLNREQISSSPSGVYNNVIVGGDLSIYLNSRTAYYIIKNNISFNPTKYHVATNVTLQNIILDNNDYYPISGTQFRWSNGSSYDFANWKILGGRDTCSINAAPQFINSLSDYQLQPASPCIGAGAYTGLTQDFCGNPVPQSNIDLGAYQFQAVSPPPPPPPTCTYSISPTGQTFSGSGGTGTIQVTSVSNCNWTAAADSSWITITAGTGGIGNGQVKFTVAPNPTRTTRSGVITVAGQQFLVGQTASTLLNNRGTRKIR